MSPSVPIEERDGDGFRRRGFEVTRLQAFVDAAFAFAVTLLVISLDGIPRNVDQLLDAIAGIPAFAASFALLALPWRMHTRYTWRFGLEDGPTTFWSLLLVFLVLVYVYPLKILFATFFGWISGGALPAHFEIRRVDDLRVMFMVYGCAWALLGGVVMALYRHAWNRRDALGLDAGERLVLRLTLVSLGFMPVLGLASTAVAALLPQHPRGWMLALPGLVYFGMFAQWPVLAWYKRRRA